jgi:hypothetical protein
VPPQPSPKAKASLGKPMANPPRAPLEPKPAPAPAAEPPPAAPETAAAPRPADPEPETPIQPAAAPRRSKLKGELKTRPRCPECGASMDEGAVVCMHCGFDQRVPEEPEVQAPPPRKPLPVVPIAAGLAVVAVLFAAFHFLGGSGEEDAPPAVSEPPPMEESDPFAEEDPDWLAPPVTPAPAAEEPIAEEATAAVEEPSPPPAVAPGPAPRPLDPAAQAAAEVQARLDAEFPLLQIDDMAAIRLDDGSGLRGRIVNINAQRVSIRVSGTVRDISLERLDHTSRLRIDPLYRDTTARQWKQEAFDRLTQDAPQD